MAALFRPLFAPCLAAALALPAAGGACAQDAGLKGVAVDLGFAIDPPPPPPFVADTRPAGDLPWIDVFAPPAEPSRKVLAPNELKAQQSELEGANARHDVARNGFAPSAKALAEKRAQMAKAAKSKKKTVEPSLDPFAPQ